MSFIIGPDGRPVLVGTEPQPGWDSRHVLTVDEMAEMLRFTVEQNRGAVRDSHVQSLVDRAMAACLDEEEIELGLSLALVASARVAGQQHMICEMLLQFMVDLKTRSTVLDNLHADRAEEEANGPDAS
jgi:hypothetical protein